MARDDASNGKGTGKSSATAPPLKSASKARGCLGKLKESKTQKGLARQPRDHDPNLILFPRMLSNGIKTSSRMG